MINISEMAKHVKPSAQDQTGGIIEKEAPIHASNVMILDSKTNAPTSKKGTLKIVLINTPIAPSTWLMSFVNLLTRDAVPNLSSSA